MIIKKILIPIIIFLFSTIAYSQEYEKVGNDSIEIIHSMMQKHLFWCKQMFKLEDVSFNYYKYNNFKHLYDSLSSIYIPFKNKMEEIGNDDNGILFCFLVDSCIVYNLQVFIPNNLYKYKELNSDKKLQRILPKLTKYGILAFKDSAMCKKIQSQYEDFKKTDLVCRI